MAMNQVGFPWWKRPGIFLPWRTHLRKTCWPHLLLDNKRFPVLRISFSVFRFLWVSLHSKLFFLDLDPTTFNTLFAFASHAVSNQARGMRAAETQGVGMDVVRPKKTKKRKGKKSKKKSSQKKLEQKKLEQKNTSKCSASSWDPSNPDIFGKYNLDDLNIPEEAMPQVSQPNGGHHGYTLVADNGAVFWFEI